MKEAAVYARVSSDRQKEEQTIESQLAELEAEARRRSWCVPPEWVFRDEGYSGANLERPGLEALRDHVYEGTISRVLVYAPDRLARNYALQVLLLDEFARSGATIEFLRSVKGESPEERLLLQFQGMIAEYERAQIIERTRRGKRYKARQGLVNVLSGAPYGYRYIKVADGLPARYLVDEAEAKIVALVFQWYAREGDSIAGIVRRLNTQRTPTRTGQTRWERTTVWGMLKNPAYQGTACFGKTKVAPRQKRTRKLRQRGGPPPRPGSHEDVPRDQWIEIPVPPLVDEETFAWAQQRLEENKKRSRRRTVEPSLLQSLLVCDQCGYALYRTSTRTSAGKRIYYYRCIGSDNYRFENGRICSRRPIRVDLLDELVWEQLIELLETPALIENEIQRRQKVRPSGSASRRRDALENEAGRLGRQMDKMLDAYQEELMNLEKLRERMPRLKDRQNRVRQELKTLDTVILNEQRLGRVSEDISGFLSCLRTNVKGLGVLEKQAIVRLLVKEIVVAENAVHIHHSIPVPQKKMTPHSISYLLRTGRRESVAGEHLPALRLGPVGEMVEEGKGRRGCDHRALCR